MLYGSDWPLQSFPLVSSWYRFKHLDFDTVMRFEKPTGARCGAETGARRYEQSLYANVEAIEGRPGGAGIMIRRGLQLPLQLFVQAQASSRKFIMLVHERRSAVSL